MLRPVIKQESISGSRPQTINTSDQRRQPDRSVDFICKVKYTNTLPDLPFDPKFLESPFPMIRRFIDYKHTSLERNYKYELLTEPCLGMKLDLIDPLTYYLPNPENIPPIDPADERLLDDETVSNTNSKRTLQHRKVVPWMRKTEYISSEVVNRPLTVGHEQKAESVKKNYPDLMYKDRESQIARIQRTFEEAQKPIKRHFSKPGVHAVEELPIFPDFEMWKYSFAQVIFDADPLPLEKKNQLEKLSNALLRGMQDAEGNQFVGYFAPTDEAIEQKELDKLTAEASEFNDLEAFKEDFRYEHKLEREYTWLVTSRGKEIGNEPECYFFAHRDGKLFYNELDSRVQLRRRPKSLSSISSKNSLLIVVYRKHSPKEQRAMDGRIRYLCNPYEVIEEDEIDDEEEEDEEEEEQQAESHEQTESHEHEQPDSHEQDDSSGGDGADSDE